MTIFLGLFFFFSFIKEEKTDFYLNVKEQESGQSHSIFLYERQGKQYCSWQKLSIAK